jgi:hypothetical protein
MDSTLLIGAIIIALTQTLKFFSPKITGIVTVVVALVVGAVIALVDVNIGLANITVAQGLLIALGAVGVHTTATSTSASPKV